MSKKKVHKRHYVYAAVLAVAISVSIWLLVDAMGKNGELWRATIFLGSVLLVVGWVVTNEVNVIGDRKRHTISLITEYMHHQQRVADKKTIKKYLPNHRIKFTADIANFDNETHELAEAVDRELNFFEFLAAAIEAGDVDEPLAKRCLRGIVINFHTQTEDYIKHWRKGSDSTWVHFVKLALHWESRPSS